MRSGGMVGARTLYALVAVVVILAILFIYLLFGNQISEEEEEETTIGSWTILIDGKETKIIHAETQEDATARWSGTVEIIVRSDNGSLLQGVKVLLQGCGITAGSITDENGSAFFFLENVTLPSGVSVGTIEVQLSYSIGSAIQVKQDSISVIREY